MFYIYERTINHSAKPRISFPARAFLFQAFQLLIFFFPVVDCWSLYCIIYSDVPWEILPIFVRVFLKLHLFISILFPRFCIFVRICICQKSLLGIRLVSKTIKKNVSFFVQILFREKISQNFSKLFVSILFLILFCRSCQQVNLKTRQNFFFF